MALVVACRSLSSDQRNTSCQQRNDHESFCSWLDLRLFEVFFDHPKNIKSAYQAYKRAGRAYFAKKYLPSEILSNYNDYDCFCYVHQIYWHSKRHLGHYRFHRGNCPSQWWVGFFKRGVVPEKSDF